MRRNDKLSPHRSGLMRAGFCTALALSGCATIGVTVGGSKPDDPDRMVSVLPYALGGYAIDGVIAGSIIMESNGYSTFETVELVLIGIDALIATVLLIDYATD